MVEQVAKTVDNGEFVARIIFSPSYVYKGRVAPTAFRWEILPSGTAEDYISVLRGDTKVLDEQTKNFKARTAGDKRYGYALLSVEKVRDIGRDNELGVPTIVDVLAYPSKAHPNHAGIVITMDNNRVTALSPLTPEIMMAQNRLASLCSEIVKF